MAATDDQGDAGEELARGVWPDVATYGTNKMYYHHTFLPHSKQRTRALCALAATKEALAGTEPRDVYTFGVYTGASCKFWHERLEATEVPFRTQWGFDSFEGLPVEAEGCELECKAWLPGAFSAADQFDVKTWAQCEARLYEHILGAEAASPAARERVQFIKGFFSDSLTPALAEARRMRPALLVDVDVDLYVSALQCLEWMLRNGLIVEGTFVYYDDVGIVKADGGGELRAHEEVTAKWRIEWTKFSDDLWRVDRVGGPAPYVGAERGVACAGPVQ